MRFKQWLQLQLEALTPLPYDNTKFIGYPTPTGVDIEVSKKLGTPHEGLWHDVKQKAIPDVQGSETHDNRIVSGFLNDMAGMRFVSIIDHPNNEHLIGDVLQALIEKGYAQPDTFVNMHDGRSGQAKDFMNTNQKAAAAMAAKPPKPESFEEKEAREKARMMAQIRAQFGSDEEYERWERESDAANNRRDRDVTLGRMRQPLPNIGSFHSPQQAMNTVWDHFKSKFRR